MQPPLPRTVPFLRLQERVTLLRRRLAGLDGPAHPWRTYGKWLAILGMACATVLLFDGWLATCGFEGCPTRAGIRAFRPGEGGRIVDRNDKFLGRIALVRRVNVSIDAIPPYVRAAFLATEDRRFYQHN
ncbi:hypothetical protein BH11GEM2_BH11GEM2_06180 [soil metagenome]